MTTHKSRSQKKVWITGGSKGIGKALACHYDQAGWLVCATSRSISTDDFPNNPAVQLYPGDLTKKDHVQSILGSILKKHGHLDQIIFNAGTHIPDSINDFNSDNVQKILNINVMSIVYGLEAVLPRFKDHSTTVGIMSSVVSYTGLPMAAGYGASKAALRNMTQSLQVELENYPLNLSLICPGFVKTPLTDKNDFEMPFILTAEKAAQIIYDGLSSKKAEIHFPLRMSLLLKFISLLPHRLRIKLLAKGIKT